MATSAGKYSPGQYRANAKPSELRSPTAALCEVAPKGGEINEMNAGNLHVLMRPLRIELLMVEAKPIVGISMMVPIKMICS